MKCELITSNDHVQFELSLEDFFQHLKNNRKKVHEIYFSTSSVWNGASRKTEFEYAALIRY